MDTNELYDLLDPSSRLNQEEKQVPKHDMEEKKKKPVGGINRELFDLIEGVAPIPLVERRPLFKGRPKFQMTARNWSWKPFTSQARADGLVLHHWAKEDTDREKLFDQYNRQVDVVTYTDEEYEAHLKDTEWTKEETDYLMDLCRRFDLRFFIIHDRYAYPSSTRTIEDMKDRYYTVTRRILCARDQPVSADLHFDKGRETERKRFLKHLTARTQDDLAEETAVFSELRKVQQQYKRWTKERETLLQVMEVKEIPESGSHPTNVRSNNASGEGNSRNNTSGTATTVHPSATSALSASHKKKKKKKEEEEEKETLQEDTTSPSSLPSVTRKQSMSHVPIATTPSTPGRRDAKFPIGVSTRSSRIPVIRGQQIASRVAQCLNEFGIGLRPTMATNDVCATYENLQSAVQQLIEMKRVYDRLEHERKTLRKRLTSLTGRLGTEENMEEEYGEGRGAIATRKRTRSSMGEESSSGVKKLKRG